MSLERDGYAIVPRVFAPAATNGGLVHQIYYSKPLCVIV